MSGPRPKDPVIEAYKKDVDRTLLRENLRLTVQERVDKMIAVLAAAEEFRKAGRELRKRDRLRGPDSPPR